jgi:hypothetical protein
MRGRPPTGRWLSANLAEVVGAPVEGSLARLVAGRALAHLGVA